MIPVATERKILDLFRRGKSVAEIAAATGVCLRTVRSLRHLRAERPRGCGKATLQRKAWRQCRAA
jgi:DNA-directed RNA polymerase specialized sigma24 family protein